MSRKKTAKITKSSTAEYFAKNLQQVGFSSPVKAVLTTLKEAVDNSLDACEDHDILPELVIHIEKKGPGALRGTDRILITVEDNGPGLDARQVPMVFGEYLASSKFGRGRCSRGQQGIGISAATTWAVQTSATGARVITKQNGQRKALSCLVVTDLKKNKGVIKEKEMIAWEKPHGTSVSFLFDGKIQINGEGGVLAYLRGNILLNPHMTLTYSLPDRDPVRIERITREIPVIPPALPPHPHTMKLGEFISHGHLFNKHKVSEWLKKGFSRLGDSQLKEIFKQAGWAQSKGQSTISKLQQEDFKTLFGGIQKATLLPPPTKSVMSVGEEALSLSIQRLGETNYFSVVSRKPTICDMKPVQVEIALARVSGVSGEADTPVSVLRFANRVPLQFDKSSCAIVKAITSVNWKTYGLKQTRGLLPTGPHIIAVSLISPFIKFKNASKETVDASDELVSEIRKALQKAGMKLSRHLRREHKAHELEAKTRHIEKFSPILVETLCRILDAPDSRKQKAQEGLNKILGRDQKETIKELEHAEEKLSEHLKLQQNRFSQFKKEDEEFDDTGSEQEIVDDQGLENTSEDEADSTAEKKVTKKKVSKKKVSKKKVTKKKVTKKKVTKKKVTKKKVTKKKVTKKKVTKKKVTKKKVTKKKVTKKKVTKKKVTKKKVTKKKVTKKKVTKKKVTKKKVTKKKVTKKKVTKKKVTKKKVTKKKVTKKKVTKKKVTKKKVTKKKVTKKKVTKKKVTKKKVTKKKVTKKKVTKKKVTKKKVTKKKVTKKKINPSKKRGR